MTLTDFWHMVKRFWVLVVLLPIVFAAAFTGYSYFAAKEQPSYSATVTIVPNSQGPTVAGLAVNGASSPRDGFSGVDIEVAYDTVKSMVTIVASGDSPETAEYCANMLALEAVKKAEALYADIPANVEIPFAAELGVATVSQDSAWVKPGYILVSLLVGLVVAFCILVLIDMVRRPVLSRESVEEQEHLSFFGDCPDGANGTRLLANLRFSLADEECFTVCLVPLSAKSRSDAVANALEAAAREDGGHDALPLRFMPSADASLSASREAITVMDSVPLSADINAAYAAQKAGITILVVREWVDTMKDLEATVEQLKRAHANLAGFIYCV